MQAPSLRQAASVSSNRIVIAFNTMPGLTYRVEDKNALNAPTWTQLAPAQVATGATLSISEPPDGRRQRFYRSIIVQ